MINLDHLKSYELAPIGSVAATIGATVLVSLAGTITENVSDYHIEPGIHDIYHDNGVHRSSTTSTKTQHTSTDVVVGSVSKDVTTSNPYAMSGFIRMPNVSNGDDYVSFGADVTSKINQLADGVTEYEKHDTIDPISLKINITADADDSWSANVINAGFGQKDPGNIAVARQYGRAIAGGLTIALQERGVKLPEGGITINAQEVILDEDSIAQLSSVAKDLGYPDLKTLLKAYNQQPGVIGNDDQKATLDRLIGMNRAVYVDIFAEQQKIQEYRATMYRTDESCLIVTEVRHTEKQHHDQYPIIVLPIPLPWFRRRPNSYYYYQQPSAYCLYDVARTIKSRIADYRGTSRYSYEDEVARDMERVALYDPDGRYRATMQQITDHYAPQRARTRIRHLRSVGNATTIGNASASSRGESLHEAPETPDAILLRFRSKLDAKVEPIVQDDAEPSTTLAETDQTTEVSLNEPTPSNTQPEDTDAATDNEKITIKERRRRDFRWVLPYAFIALTGVGAAIVAKSCAPDQGTITAGTTPSDSSSLTGTSVANNGNGATITPSPTQTAPTCGQEYKVYRNGVLVEDDKVDGKPLLGKNTKVGDFAPVS